MSAREQLELPAAIDDDTRAAIAYCLGLLTALVMDLEIPRTMAASTRGQVARMIQTAAAGVGVRLDASVVKVIAERAQRP